MDFMVLEFVHKVSFSFNNENALTKFEQNSSLFLPFLSNLLISFSPLLFRIPDTSFRMSE